jgi:hypothetical protein
MLAAAARVGRELFLLFQRTFLMIGLADMIGGVDRIGHADRTIGPPELRGSPELGGVADGRTFAVASAVTVISPPNSRRSSSSAVRCTVTLNDIRSAAASAWITSEGRPATRGEYAAASVARARARQEFDAAAAMWAASSCAGRVQHRQKIV